MMTLLMVSKMATSVFTALKDNKELQNKVVQRLYLAIKKFLVDKQQGTCSYQSVNFFE